MLGKAPVDRLEDGTVITATGQYRPINLMFPPESQLLRVLEGLQGSVMRELCRRSVQPGAELGLHAVDGARVVVKDLISHTGMNGKRGMVLSYEKEKGRFSIILDEMEGIFELLPANLSEEPGCFAQDRASRLLEQTDHINAHTRCAAIEAIGRMGETNSALARAVDARLQDGNAHVRQAACEALGMMGKSGSGALQPRSPSFDPHLTPILTVVLQPLRKM
jgi:hypothetical protein